MRWLVVTVSAPLAKRPPGMAQAHPPGPGFPTQAPSVYTIVAITTACRKASTSRPEARGWMRDIRRFLPSGPRHRPRGDPRVARLLRPGRGRPGPDPGHRPAHEAG